jgi:omega-3 fatty acid desaturase (delta-15 desaturase)
MSANVTITSIQNALSPDVFIKRPLLGFYYICKDFFLLLSTVYLFSLAEQTYLNIGLYWASSGFWMWCLFVNGHDCGHGSFSDSWLLNTIAGHLCHTPILLPYSVWTDSHHRHHIGNNHIKNDYSHPWTPVHRKNKKDFVTKLLQRFGLYPVLGWMLYLLGIPDGGHWIPFGGRLWRNADVYSRIHGIISSGLCALFVYNVYMVCGDIGSFFIWYGGPWFVFSWWLTTVTYLQHHDNKLEDTIVYGDESWTYLKGALQTVDRSYGYVIDTLVHNMTDGHLVHHLFFKKIPHYHLEKATKQLYKYLDDNGVEYKFRKTPFFFLDIYKLTWCHLNEATLVK